MFSLFNYYYLIMSAKINFYQCVGWQDQDIFASLASLSDNDFVKEYMPTLLEKYNIYGNSFTYIKRKTKAYYGSNEYITSKDMIKAEDMYNYYDEKCGLKRKPKLVQSIEDESTADFVFFNLWEFIKVVNKEKGLDLKLVVLGSSLIMYVGELYSFHEDVYEEDSWYSCIDLALNNLPINEYPNAKVITITSGYVEAKEEYPDSYGENDCYCDCSTLC